MVSSGLASTVPMQLASYMKTISMRAIVKWTSREAQCEADALVATRSFELLDPALRLLVAADQLRWEILLEVLVMDVWQSWSIVQSMVRDCSHTEEGSRSAGSPRKNSEKAIHGEMLVFRDLFFLVIIVIGVHSYLVPVSANVFFFIPWSYCYVRLWCSTCLPYFPQFISLLSVFTCGRFFSYVLSPSRIFGMLLISVR